MNFKSVYFVVVALTIIVSILNFLRPYDNTDDAINKSRNGLRLYTDNLTGCQYIKASYFSELTKRVDGKGNHVGCK